METGWSVREGRSAVHAGGVMPARLSHGPQPPAAPFPSIRNSFDFPAAAAVFCYGRGGPVPAQGTDRRVYPGRARAADPAWQRQVRTIASVLQQ